LPILLSKDQVLRLRTRAQRLDGRMHDDGVAGIAAGVAGLQAQNTAAADLSMRARDPSLTVSDVKRAVVNDRSVVRTWCMRGTLHLVAAGDLRWLLTVLAPRAIDRSRPRMRQLGLDEDTADRGVRRLAEVLADGTPRTRAEIADLLAGDDIPLEGQALPHLLRRGALRGVICNGPLRGGDSTYVLLDAWLGPAFGADEAAGDGLARLAGRYLAAYGPASLDDFTYWSGLRKTDARRGWDAIDYETVDMDAAGQAARMPANRMAWLDPPGNDRAVAGPVVRLLGMFDTYLLGYRSRQLALDPVHTDRLIPGTGGMIRAALLVDGRVQGAWKTRRTGGGLEILLEPFGKLSTGVRRGLQAEVEGIGRFLGVPARLRTKTT
jgi:hypothetical protein